jgi:hypothetical protein
VIAFGLLESHSVVYLSPANTHHPFSSTANTHHPFSSTANTHHPFNSTESEAASLC